MLNGWQKFQTVGAIFYLLIRNDYHHMVTMILKSGGVVPPATSQFQLIIRMFIYLWLLGPIAMSIYVRTKRIEFQVVWKWMKLKFPQSIFIFHGNVQHAEVVWKGAVELRYHMNIIPDDKNLKDVILYAYGYKFQIKWYLLPHQKVKNSFA